MEWRGTRLSRPQYSPETVHEHSLQDGVTREGIGAISQELRDDCESRLDENMAMLQRNSRQNNSNAEGGPTGRTGLQARRTSAALLICILTRANALMYLSCIRLLSFPLLFLPSRIKVAPQRNAMQCELFSPMAPECNKDHKRHLKAIRPGHWDPS